MARRIAIIQGHPDPEGGHYCHAVADAYRKGAVSAGHEVTMIVPAHLDVPLLSSKADWEHAEAPHFVEAVQQSIWHAEHLVIIYPLWLGTMPALLKAFLEQVLRPGFAFEKGRPGKLWKKRLSGRSARVIVTMGMPAFFFRWFYFAHGLRSLERNILSFCGFGPVRDCIIGMVEDPSDRRRRDWLKKIERLGTAGA